MQLVELALRHRAEGHRSAGRCPSASWGTRSRRAASRRRTAASPGGRRRRRCPPWGGGPYLKASSRKPNFARASSSDRPERAEDARLHVGAMDPDRAARDLVAVEHQVVGARPHAGRIALEAVEIVGRGEVNGWWAAARWPSSLRLEQRELGDPAEPPAALSPSLGMRPSLSARCRRRAPSTVLASLLARRTEGTADRPPEAGRGVDLGAGRRSSSSSASASRRRPARRARAPARARRTPWRTPPACRPRCAPAGWRARPAAASP